MRTCIWVAAAVFLTTSIAGAEDKPNPEQIKKAYDDALVQLKAAQNSKNQLAKDNEKLTKQVDDLKKQLAAAQRQVRRLSRQVSDNDEKTFYLRSHYAVWQAFLRAHPKLLVEWKLFLGNDALSSPDQPRPLIEPDWLLLDEHANTSPSGD